MTRNWFGEVFNEDERSFADAVDHFCVRECPPERLAEWSDGGRLAHAPELYAHLAKTGWVGLTIPEEFGGAGGTLRDALILLERLSYHRLPVGGYLTALIVSQAIIRYGTDAQKAAILPGVAGGDILAIGITEPQAGSDAAALTTAARKSGDNWRINGQKIYTTNANHAKWIVLVTRTETAARKQDGITLFILPMDRKGISFTPIETLGQLDTNITYYDDVEASDDEILGEPGKGWSALGRGLNSERVIVAAQATGVGQRAFDDALAYVKTREQFGQTIGRFQAIQHGLAETATELAAARLLTYYAADLLDAGEVGQAQASMAKLKATEVAQRAALQGMQFLGGLGYTMDTEMQSYVRDTLAMTIFGGTSQIQKHIVATELGLNVASTRNASVA